jgi:hypothetical protein
MLKKWVWLIVLLLLPLSLNAQSPTPRPTSTPRLTSTPRVTAEATSESTPEATSESTAEATAEATSEATEDPNSCPAIVQSALRVTQEACGDIGVDEICYGYIVLEASPRSGVAEFTFVQPGDIADIIDIESLQLDAMDVERGVWGVVMMRVADPNNPGAEPATVLMFGNVDLTATNQFLPITANEDLMILETPESTTEVGPLAEGETITANGRLEDSTWLRVLVTREEELPTLGWLPTELVTADGDIEVLPVVSPEDVLSEEDVVYGPMQAFVFESGSGDALCPEAPNSGLLIQTPEGQASVSFVIDEVVITVSGTAFVEAEAGGTLDVYAVDGSTEVEANGESSVAVEGTVVNVGLDEDLTPTTGPSDPSAYDPENVQALPTNLLDNPVDTAAPLDVPEGYPIPGNWLFTWSVAEMSCPDGTVVPFQSTGETSVIQVQGTALTIGGLPYSFSGGTFVTAYSDGFGNLHSITVTVVEPDFISGQDVIDYLTFTCTLTVPFTMQLVSGG